MMIKRVVFAWDFLLAIVGAIFIAVVFPCALPIDFAKDIYNVGISVLSIVFSVFFAALAIIMASSDDDFVRFLEKDGDYTLLINTFQVSLSVLFVALIFSIVLYTYSAFRLANHVLFQRKWWLVAFGFLFLWGLFAAASSIHDAILYSKFRSRFLLLAKKEVPRN
jgi:hypothetical protein